MRRGIVYYVVVLMLLSSCAKTRIKDHTEWGKFYTENGINNACFMMYDNNHESVHYYNVDRCKQKFLPASTFKIFNSLVALETGVAPNDQTIIKWDSVVRPRQEWNKDMTIREAFTLSCLPCFQQMARAIGKPRMQHYLDTVKYGNMKIGDKVDEFWLNNTLQISADEQVGFIKRLYFNELPFSEGTQRIVRSMMLHEDSANYRIYYKTGTGYINADSAIYWIVGFAEKIENIKEPKAAMNPANVRTYPYFFAQNFTVSRADTTHDWSKVRVDILHSILKDHGVTAQL